MKRLVLAIILFASPSFAMEHLTRTLQDQNGSAISGASVKVYKAGTSTLATIYSDNGVTQKTNPFSTGIDGIYDFYAENNVYDIVFSHPRNISDATKTARVALFDPNDGVPQFVNNIIDTSYTVVASDKTKLLSICNEATVNVTLPQAIDAFGSGWHVDIQNRCSGSVIITPTISTIDDDPSLTLILGQGVKIVSDGQNYFVQLGGGAGSGGSAQGLDANFDVVNEINGAVIGKPVIIGNGTQKLEIFGDATLGGVIRPSPLGDSVWRCWTNFNCIIRDEEAGATVLTIDPDAANTNAMYQFGTNYRPKKSVWIGAGALDGDGTNCQALASTVTINSGPKLPTIICADNDGSRIHGSVLMPNDWDGGTLTFTQVVIQTAANTSALNGDVAAQCRGAGETPGSTYGTEVALDIASLGGSNKNDTVTSGAVTPTGTCAANDMLYFYYDVDATGTTTAMATLHILGFRITYTSTSLSQ